MGYYLHYAQAPPYSRPGPESLAMAIEPQPTLEAALARARALLAEGATKLAIKDDSGRLIMTEAEIRERRA